MRRAAPAFLSLVVALAGAGAACSGGDDPDPGAALAAVAETQERFGSVERGRLALAVSVSGRVGEREGTTGWRVEGSFRLPGAEGDLPTADLEYTQAAGDDEATVRIVSGPGGAALETEDGPCLLGAEATSALAAVGPADGEGLLGGLDLDAWLEGPDLDEGPEVDGDPTDLVTADVDVAAVLDDLGGLGLPALDRSGRRQVVRAVRSAEVEMVTGREDRMLRRLHLEVELRGGDDLPEALAGFADAAVTVDLALDDLGDPVEAPEVPAGAPPCG